MLLNLNQIAAINAFRSERPIACSIHLHIAHILDVRNGVEQNAVNGQTKRLDKNENSVQIKNYYEQEIEKTCVCVLCWLAIDAIAC